MVRSEAKAGYVANPPVVGQRRLRSISSEAVYNASLQLVAGVAGEECQDGPPVRARAVKTSAGLIDLRIADPDETPTLSQLPGLAIGALLGTVSAELTDERYGMFRVLVSDGTTREGEIILLPGDTLRWREGAPLDAPDVFRLLAPLAQVALSEAYNQPDVSADSTTATE
jgi:hypothetical protein